MKLYIKYDQNTACKVILQEQFEKMDLAYELTGLGEVEFKKAITDEEHLELSENLRRYGIEIMDTRISILVQKTKDAIIEMINLEEDMPASKVSHYLAKKLNYSFGYISSLFSDVTYTSIGNFIILQKIERVKQLIISEELTLTQIAIKLNYSSVAHLSNQFKKTTGITPSAFQRIIKKRREANSN